MDPFQKTKKEYCGLQVLIKNKSVNSNLPSRNTIFHLKKLNKPRVNTVAYGALNMGTQRTKSDDSQIIYIGIAKIPILLTTRMT